MILDEMEACGGGADAEAFVLAARSCALAAEYDAAAEVLRRASNVRVKSMGSASEVQVDGASFETFFIDESMLAAPKSGRYETGDEEAYDEPIEDGQIDMGELVAQHLYLYVSKEQQGEMREAASEFAPGEVVLDTGDDLE